MAQRTLRKKIHRKACFPSGFARATWPPIMTSEPIKRRPAKSHGSKDPGIGAIVVAALQAPVALRREMALIPMVILYIIVLGIMRKVFAHRRRELRPQLD